MQVVSNYIGYWKKIPPQVKKILGTGFLLLIVWKLAYTLWLQPNRILDEPLTHMVANQTAWLMNSFSDGSPYKVGESLRRNAAEDGLVTRYGTIFKNGKRMINIADPCNGLEFLLLYAWFILVMPGTVKRKILYLAGGLLLLHFSNLLRCWGLMVVQQSYPDIFNFAHHYLFKIIIYGISFGLWYAYLRTWQPTNIKDEATT